MSGNSFASTAMKPFASSLSSAFFSLLGTCRQLRQRLRHALASPTECTLNNQGGCLA